MKPLCKAVLILSSLVVISLAPVINAMDWPLFNCDENNGCFTSLRGEIDLDNPKLKWQRDIPAVWTGFTYSPQGNLLTVLPAAWDKVLALNTETGGVLFSYNASHIGMRDQIGSSGTGEGIPLLYDINEDGVADIFAPIDSYGIIVWNGLDRGTPIWSVPLPSEHAGGGGSLNAVLGDVNGDGGKELVVMNSSAAVRNIRCYDAATGTEFWVFNNRGFPGGKGMQGEITQNFPVWFDVDGDGKPELFFQHQTTVGPNKAVDIFCIKTEPTLKTFTYLNNPPSPYSHRPIQPWSGIIQSDNPTVGKYELFFHSHDKVSVNGGPPVTVKADSKTRNKNVVPGLDLVFAPETAIGDKAIVYVHNAPRLVWKKTFVSGYCFAHFLLSDFNNDGEQEIAFGTAGKYYLINKYGDVLWQYDTGLPYNDYEDIVWGGAFADIDEDGVKEIVFIAFDTVVCLKGDTGEVKWTFQVPRGDLRISPFASCTNALRAYPLIADIGGTRDLEIVTADAEYIYALNKDGHVVMKCKYATYDPVSHHIVSLEGDRVVYPYTSKRFIFADIDKDGKGELIGSYVISPGRAAHRVFCLE